MEVFGESISNFSCAKNEDLAEFLHNSAEKFERLDKSRTYLFVEKDELGGPRILGYFSIAVHSVNVPEGMGMRKIRMLDGYSAKRNGAVVSVVPAYLIGQLAKNDMYSHELSGDEMLAAAISTIEKARNVAGGRLIVIDCKPIEKLHEFYTRNGFILIGHDEETGLDQFVYFLNTRWLQGGAIKGM